MTDQHFNFHAARRRFAVLAVWHDRPCGTATCPASGRLSCLSARPARVLRPRSPLPSSGQFHTRVAKTVESPVTANVLALESRDGDNSLDSGHHGLLRPGS